MNLKFKSALAVIAALCAVLLVKVQRPVAPPQLSAQDQVIADVYSAWKLENKRLYASAEEDSLRFGVFKANYKMIQETNAKGLGFTLGLNASADLTYEEFAKQGNLKTITEIKKEFATNSGARTASPETMLTSQENQPQELAQQQLYLNWQTLGKSNPARDVKNCPVYELFSVLSVFESIDAIAQKKTV